jgi:hypothetical protein
MSSFYYFAAGTDSGCLFGCDHEHRTVISAVACIATAGGYVVAVENGELRQLNYKEEAEFQFAMYGANRSKREIKAFAPNRILDPLLN